MGIQAERRTVQGFAASGKIPLENRVASVGSLAGKASRQLHFFNFSSEHLTKEKPPGSGGFWIVQL
jgi:hypothetical protein